MKKLKGLNWKQFFVNHFEKLVFGLVILIGLGALAMSRWAPYRAKNPAELQAQVVQAEQQHAQGTWPEEKQQEYADVNDISAKAEALLASLDVNRFMFSANQPGFFPPVIDNKQPIGDIEWLPIDQMIADAGRVLISTAPAFDPTMMNPAMGTEMMPGMPGQMPGAAGMPGQPGTQGQQTPVDNRYAPRRGGGMGMGMDGMTGMEGGPGMAPGMAPGGAGMAPGAPGAGGRGNTRNRNRNTARGGAAPDEAMMMPEMEGMPGMEGSMGPVMEGEGKRFVSVRGVFPLKQQEEILAKALHLRTTAEATQRLQFIDYELERQVAQAGPDPWSGPWEKVDRQIAEDIVAKSAGTESVVYDPSTTSGVFTMPLPMRLMGYWTPEEASHPALEKFSGTEQARQQEAWIKQKIAEYNKEMEELEKTQPIGGGGWQKFQRGIQDIGSTMMEDPMLMGQMAQSYNQTFGGGAGGGNQARGMRPADIKAQIEAMITASGTYLLFRYLDFDVKPGYAYRYRVRLQVANPAQGLDATMVERPDIAEGPTRWTPWSDPTPVAVVPKDTEHFLASVVPGTRTEPTRARFEMYQWSEDIGTVVNQVLEVTPGAAIGGQVETTVIDPAANTAEPKSVEFKSGDVLVDIMPGVNSGADRSARTGSGANYVIPDQILYVNDWGGLQVSNRITRAEDRLAYREDFKAFREAYKDLTDPAPPETGMEGMEGMLPGEEMMMEEGMPGGRRGRGRGR